MFLFNEFIFSLKKLTIFLYLFDLLLFRLPSFYILPNNPILTSHNLATYILILLFLFSISLIIKKEEKLNCDWALLVFVLFYFVTQSFSIVGSINLFDFLNVYKNIALGIMFFLTSLVFLKSKHLRILITLLIASIGLNLIYQFGFYLNLLPQRLLETILYEKYLRSIEIRAAHGKYFIEIIDGALLLYIFYFIKTLEFRKIIEKILLILLAALSFYAAVISNYRTILLMSFFSILFGCIFFFKRKGIIVIITLLVALIFFGKSFSISKLQSTSVERLISPTDHDFITINSRFYYWSKAIEMGSAFPLTGIGLGNYYDYLSDKETIINSVFEWKNDLMRITSIHPHNILFASFAESGLLGFLSFILLIGYFLIYDLKFLSRYSSLININKNIILITMVSFWTLFFYSLVGSGYGLGFQILFWLLRAICNRFMKTLLFTRSRYIL